MFREINLNLGDGYKITAIKETDDIAVLVTHNSEIVGQVRLTTDNVDVSCVTIVSIDDKHVDFKFSGQYTLGEVLIKYLIKFPAFVRKPEFRFILDASNNLKTAIKKHHFDRGENSSLEN